MSNIKQLCFFLLIVVSGLRLDAQSGNYQKEVAKANKWNESQYRIIKSQFSSLTGCLPEKVKISISQSQYAFYGASRYGEGKFNSSQEAHDKVLAKRVEVSGCGKIVTYMFSSHGKWEQLDKSK